jgi:hypothetical protein
VDVIGGSKNTHTRIKANWFVVSGFMAGRYSTGARCFAAGSTVIGNLLDRILMSSMRLA